MEGTILRKKDPNSGATPPVNITKPLPPEKAKEVAGAVANNWFYGEGLGSTAITAGTCIIFPPYLAVVVGNAALSISGYEPISVSNMLTEEQGKDWSDAYETVASGPGRLTSAVAGKEYRTKEVIKTDYQKLLAEEQAQPRKEK